VNASCVILIEPSLFLLFNNELHSLTVLRSDSSIHATGPVERFGGIEVMER
jgi:hypothetical protein